MRRLLPYPAAEVDALALYADGNRTPPAHRPYVVVNMVASVDGATAVGGVTRALGSPADRAIFLHLRHLADAVLVGAATVRMERYGPVRLDASERGQRQRRGKAPRPPIVVVSRSLDFDWQTPFFVDADPRAIILAPADAEPDRLEQARDRAEVIATGRGTVDLANAFSQLRRRGISLLLCEGGPTLNSELVTAGLIDELCLTVAPLLAPGGPKGILGPGFDQRTSVPAPGAPPRRRGFSLPPLLGQVAGPYPTPNRATTVAAYEPTPPQRLSCTNCPTC